MVIDMNVYELLVIGDLDLLIHQIQGEWAMKNPKIIRYIHYVQKLCKRFHKIEFKHTHRIKNELVNALAHVEAEQDGYPWYFNIKKQLEFEIYHEEVASNQKKPVRRMALNFCLSGEILYRRTHDLGLLRCVDAVKLINQIHA